MTKSDMRFIFIYSLLIATAVVLTDNSFVRAQQPSGTQPTQTTPQPGDRGFTPTKKPFKRNKTEFQVQHLAAPVELPGLPSFPIGQRAEFEGGQLAPNTKSGKIYTLIYRAKDPGPIVLNWYEQAFKSGPWSVQRVGNMIAATMPQREGVRCNVFLLRAIKQGFKTNFVVMYTVPPD
jgi:hypothetical protein